ncbi:MAG: hypothetical protein P0116_10225 [Candidatus Nitrosocosmicus sp.]|nr:hypothetical protein [Candidatus Nitrosocosmicus sp.]
MGPFQKWLNIQKNNYLDTISVSLIGSIIHLTGDMYRAADIAKQAIEKGIKTKTPLQVTPGSENDKRNDRKTVGIQLLRDIGAKCAG